MIQTYRVRFSTGTASSEWLRPAAQTIDISTDLDHIPESLPANSQILSIENLTTDQTVHWTRWPKAYRPGFGG